MKKLIIIIVLGIFGCSAFAQSIEFTKANFPNDKRQLKAAVDNIKFGDELYNNPENKLSFRNALDFYLEANAFNEKNAALSLKIANCYNALGSYDLAAKFGEKAYDIDPNVNYKAIFFKGMAQQSRGELNKAISSYSNFETRPEITAAEKTDAKKRIEECKRGINMMKYEYNCFIDNLGSGVNSNFDEYGPVVTINNDVMYFTSRRGGKKIKMSDDGKYYENVYESKVNERGNFQTPTRIKKVCDKKHVAVQAISKDGSRIIVYKPKNGGDLFEATLKNGTFGKPKNMGKKINSSYHETSASYSITGDTLFFCSEREGGFGHHDVYMSVRDGKKWGEAINMGKIINTEDDEISVFSQADGTTLYICSDGHETMGGIDIFVSKLENGSWTKPTNIGYPINTPNDDVYFTVTQDGKYAYYASAQEGGYGGYDLYKITLLGPQKLFVLHTYDNLIQGEDLLASQSAQALAVEEEKITILKGTVLDADTKQPVIANIELADVTENEVLATFSSDINGKYMLSLPAGKNYSVAVKAPKYLFHSENFNIPDSANKQVIEQIIYLEKIAVNKAIVLKNIFFDNAKATLRKESLVEIENVYKLLIENPTLHIEISGHTDNVGKRAYNQKLSHNRAKAVVDALVKKGISQERLTYAGYGFDKPIAKNDTPENRQLNRRTEFKVTKM